MIGVGGCKSPRVSTDETPVIVETVRLLLAVDVDKSRLHSPYSGGYRKSTIETNNVTNVYHKLHYYQSVVQFDLTKAVVKSFAQIQHL